MIDDLIENEKFRRYFPPVAAAGLIALFVSLGFWQLDRAAQKRATQALFESDAAFANVADVVSASPYQRLEASGHFDAARQILIDNVIVNDRIGYYVITPFRHAPDRPLLMVNRGWVAKGGALPEIGLDDDERTIRGLAGHLPVVGIRSGPAFFGDGSWPKVARYPTLDELAAKLSEDVAPFVLLLDAASEYGFVRAWQPQESGPAMHYGYAFQWFAMAAGVLALFAWQLRKRRRPS